MGRINIVFETDGKWILPRLASALVDGIPNAVGVGMADTKEMNHPDTLLNYYVNDMSLRASSKFTDIVFFDHPKRGYACTEIADYGIAINTQYQQALIARGLPCDLVIQPTDPTHFTPKLILGFVGRFKGHTDYSKRKGAKLLEQVQELPFVEMRYTLGRLQHKDLPNFYRQLDYVIVTSDPEGGPMCVTEGMACGKKIIMPLSVGVADFFSDGIVDYPVGDFDALRDVLEGLYEDKKRLHDQVSKYTWGYWVQQHKDIFHRILTDKQLTVETQEVERAIVVVATPEMKEVTDQTLPAIKRYATKCKADLIIWDDVPTEYKHPKYRLMAMRDIKAKRIAHFDGDTAPAFDAPDIFEMYPAGSMYMWDEKEIRKPGEIASFQAGIEKHTNQSVAWDGHWWNPGVMLCDNEHLRAFEMPPWDPTEKQYLWYGNTVKNQPWLNWNIRHKGIQVKPLDRNWNCITALKSSHPEDAHILHFGAEKVPDIIPRKLAMIDRYRAKISPRVLLVTVVVGKAAEELHAITGKYMRDYCTKQGFKFHVITENPNNYPSPSWYKLACADYFAAFNVDCIVFVDNDIWIRPDSPSVVDEVPVGKFGAFNSYTLPYMCGLNSNPVKSFRLWAASMELDIDAADKPFMINGGLWVCWKEAKHILQCDKAIELDGYYEQHLLNVNLWEDTSVYHELGKAWNYGHLHVEQRYTYAKDTSSLHFLHLNGVAATARVQVLQSLCGCAEPSLRAVKSVRRRTNRSTFLR